MADATKQSRIAYLRFFDRNAGVTRPRREPSVRASGSSKISPNASVNLRMKSTYRFTERVGTRFPVLKLMQEMDALGTMTVIAKLAPTKKKSVDRMTNGSANLRSCGRRPGAMNPHTWLKEHRQDEEGARPPAPPSC